MGKSYGSVSGIPQGSPLGPITTMCICITSIETWVRLHSQMMAIDGEVLLSGTEAWIGEWIGMQNVQNFMHASIKYSLSALKHGVED